MKTSILKSLAALAMSTLLLTAFQCETPSAPYAIEIKQTACGEHFDTDSAKGLGDEEAFVVGWDHGNVRVTHLNWVVPCDWRNVSVDVTVDGSTVILNECGEGGEVDCICSIDNTYLIAYLEPGEYTFVFQSCGLEVYRQQYEL